MDSFTAVNEGTLFLTVQPTNVTVVDTTGGPAQPGMTVVIVLHIALAYALVHGLARKIVEVVKAPLETKIIEEVKKRPTP